MYQIEKNEVMTMVNKAVDGIFNTFSSVWGHQADPMPDDLSQILEKNKEEITDTIFAILIDRYRDVSFDDIVRVVNIVNERLLPYGYFKNRITNVGVEYGWIKFTTDGVGNFYARIDSEGAFIITNSKKECLYDFKEVYKWTDEDVQFLKYGIREGE